MAQIHTRVTLIDKDGDPKRLQMYESYVWLPKGTTVRYQEKDYVVDDYKINVTKNILDIIVIDK
jgi:hypothetical protein